jgi:acyl-CoA synthetase (AMP-forming)/AMP-acid ligase II
MHMPAIDADCAGADAIRDTDCTFRVGGGVDEAGRLLWEGRLNDIIKTGGTNVSPLEIDTVIKDCPDRGIETMKAMRIRRAHVG